MAGQPNVETLVLLQPIAVDTGSLDRAGMLVMANGLLVAVLSRLDEPGHDEAGGWFLEVGFGRLQGSRPAPFTTLDEATRWVRQRLKAWPG